MRFKTNKIFIKKLIKKLKKINIKLKKYDISQIQILCNQLDNHSLYVQH
jgi:hypothetical protein